MVLYYITECTQRPVICEWGWNAAICSVLYICISDTQTKRVSANIQFNYEIPFKDTTDTSLPNIAFPEQSRLYSLQLGFVTWYSNVCELASSYGITLNSISYSKT